MKTKYMLVVLLSFLFGSTGCDDELSWSSQDLVIPGTASHYFELFRGEIMMTMSPMWRTNYMTDELKDIYNPDNPGLDYRTRQAGYFTWQEKPELTMDGDYEDDECWGYYYHIALVCNVALNDMEAGKIEGSREELELLEAEARFFRAQAYFQLVNLYAPPYENESQAKDAPGVPLNLSGITDDKEYERSTLAEVYGQITEDITKSIALFQKSGDFRRATIFRPGFAAANYLAGRICLYMKDYQKSLDYIAATLKASDLKLYDLNAMEHEWDSPCFLSKENPEILYSYSSQQFRSFQGREYDYDLSTRLYDLLAAPGSLRRKSFLSSYSNNPEKYVSHRSSCYGINFRLSELLLNRAECYIALGDWKKAVDDVNAIREKRFEKGSDYKIHPADGEEALQLVKDERLAELCFEDLRWFDLRRWGMKRMVHTFYTGPGVMEEYVLEEGSPSFTLPIPKKELDLNQIIEILPRQKQKPLPIGSK